MIGLESSEDTTPSTTEENQTESSTEPCIGLCQLEKTNKIEKDQELNSLKSRKSQRCVGLCYILRFWKYLILGNYFTYIIFSIVFQEERADG